MNPIVVIALIVWAVIAILLLWMSLIDLEENDYAAAQNLNEVANHNWANKLMVFLVLALICAAWPIALPVDYLMVDRKRSK